MSVALQALHVSTGTMVSVRADRAKRAAPTRSGSALNQSEATRRHDHGSCATTASFPYTRFLIGTVPIVRPCHGRAATSATARVVMTRKHPATTLQLPKSLA